MYSRTRIRGVTARHCRQPSCVVPGRCGTCDQPPIGYALTTPQDLIDALGIGKGSLYNAFGSKHACSNWRYNAMSRAKPNPCASCSTNPVR
jgi:hypothetical protein